MLAIDTRAIYTRGTDYSAYINECINVLVSNMFHIHFNLIVCQNEKMPMKTVLLELISIGRLATFELRVRTSYVVLLWMMFEMSKMFQCM